MVFMLVVENMSLQGYTIGGRFEELAGIIDRVEDKSRIGVTLDTCHAFAAGVSLSRAPLRPPHRFLFTVQTALVVSIALCAVPMQYSSTAVYTCTVHIHSRILCVSLTIFTILYFMFSEFCFFGNDRLQH